MQQNSGILILYATQTGNSLYLAEELQRLLMSYGVIVKLRSLDEYNWVNLPEEQRGDGQPPTSMLKFWQFLLIKNLPQDSLNGLKFSVYGLGDSSYSKFNYTAIKLRARLLQLGAGPEVPESAYGDEQHPCGVETEFLLWSKKVVDSLNLNQHQFSTENILSVELLLESRKQPWQSGNWGSIVPLKEKQQLTPPDHPKVTLNVIFQTTIKYQPGDILLIKPKNSIQVVQQLCDLLNLNKQDRVKLNWTIEHYKQQLPNPIGLWELLMEELDLSSPPTRFFLKTLSKYAENALHKEKLELMSSLTPEGLEEYYSYIFREKRNPYEVLFDFQPCKIPLDQLILSLNLMRPRQFSISTFRDGEVGITISLVQYRTNLNRTIKGVCSRYLEETKIGDNISIKLDGRLQLNFPMDFTTPVIMIGPGTGVSSFIGYIEYRKTIWGDNIIDPVNTILFFGSCYKEKEFYYQEFLEKIKDKMMLFTAFSRDQKNKIYVQDKIKENTELLQKHIQGNLDKIRIYVSGTSKNMPQQVEQALESVIGKEKIQLLKKTQQYMVECW